MEVIECKFQRGIVCLDHRIWDPGITHSQRINESVQEKILSIINNIDDYGVSSKRLYARTIGKNDDLFILGIKSGEKKKKKY